MTNCYECGAEILDDEIFLSDEKIPGTNLYKELCSECFEGGNDEQKKEVKSK